MPGDEEEPDHSGQRAVLPREDERALRGIAWLRVPAIPTAERCHDEGDAGLRPVINRMRRMHAGSTIATVTAKIWRK